MSMLPVTELRLSIPWAVTIGGMPWPSAFAISIAGNFLITIPIVYLLGPASDFLRRWKYGDIFLNWLFARTRRKGTLIEKIEFVGLMLFVGIPLPMTGAWTGAIAAFVFGLGNKRALLAIMAGLLISATIVTVLTISGTALFLHFSS
ncbi:MAG: small multi-drug export protein [FCB group bacterium]|nr:small multi-drug export protein [FCB group bacterium]